MDALPENLGMKKHKHKKKVYFNINDLDASKKGLAEITEIEKHKLNGWINLWAFDGGEASEQKDSPLSNILSVTTDMVSSALGTLQTMTEPVILNLCEDKVKYERVFARLNNDATDIAGLKQINDLVDTVITKASCYNFKIKQPTGAIFLS